MKKNLKNKQQDFGKILLVSVIAVLIGIAIITTVAHVYYGLSLKESFLMAFGISFLSFIAMAFNIIPRR